MMQLTASHEKLAIYENQLPQTGPQERLLVRFDDTTLRHASIELAEDVAFQRFHGFLGDMAKLLVHRVREALGGALVLVSTVVDAIAVA